MSAGRNPILIVIAGSNGSGKTTITSKLLKSEWLEDTVYINPDNVVQEMFGDWNSQEAVLKASCRNHKTNFIKPFKTSETILFFKTRNELAKILETITNLLLKVGRL